MEQLRAGLVLALATAREQLQLSVPYWQVIRPWGYIYIALAAIYQLFYPQGHSSYVLGILWALIFTLLSINMAWNWANVLSRRAARVGWDSGWDNPDYREYASGMLLVVLGIPIAVAFLTAVPAILLLLILSGDENQMAYILTVIVSTSVAYILARLLPVSAALLARISSPLPVVWQRGGKHQLMMVAALLAVVFANSALGMVLVFLATLLDGLGLPRADMIVLPAALALGVYTVGWLVLLSQRIFVFLDNPGGCHA